MSDVFDTLLNRTAQVLKRGVGAGNAYGISPQTFIPVGAPIPVAVWAQSGQEKLDGKKMALRTSTVFLRPWLDPDNNPLTEHHWFLIDGEYYNIIFIDNPMKLDHHLEATCRIIKP